MISSRRATLAVLLVVMAAVNAVILGGMLATVFFAITVAYVLGPVATWVHGRGHSRWVASTVATSLAVLGILALFVPLVVVLYLRRSQISAILEAIPDTVTVDVAGITYPIEIGSVISAVGAYLAAIAPTVAVEMTILATKAIAFLFVVFAILLRREELGQALLGPLPDELHDLAFAYHERVRETLYALYVTQAATGLGTFLVAAPTFWLLGYDAAITLALVAGILQFLPVIGPSVVVIGIAAFEVTQGETVMAGIVLVVGLVLIAFLPDAVLRPQLARRTARFPASLYFVGFIGGVLSLGAVGIIAGPLAVALLVETVSLLADDVHSEGA